MKFRLSGVILSCLCLYSGVSSQAADNRGVVEVSGETFECIRDMTPVRGFYVDNLLGDLEATLATANAADGGVYPPGSVVQLVPGEVMVKRASGVSPATNDWEFFELDVSPAGTVIRKRGYADVVNRFGGNCLACHAKAEPKWDMICETGHGCDPIPLTRDMLVLLQKTDPRCKDNPTLSPEELEKLKALQQALQPQG
jgi:hypothetical protein